MKWGDIFYSKRDEIIDLAKEAELEAMDVPVELDVPEKYRQYYKIDVLVSLDGDCYLVGPRTNEKMTEDERNGYAKCIYTAWCIPFDINDAMNYVKWPDSMTDFFNNHSWASPVDNGSVFTKYCLENGEEFYLDAPIPDEVIHDFKIQMIDSLNIESRIYWN